MNKLHMTPYDWARYIQEFNPANEQQATEYLDDMARAYDSNSITAEVCSRSANRVKKMFTGAISERAAKLERKIDLWIKEDQLRIQEGFFRK